MILLGVVEMWRLTVDHGGIVAARAACADRVVCRPGVFPNECGQFRVIDLARPGRHGCADVGAAARRCAGFCEDGKVLGDVPTGPWVRMCCALRYEEVACPSFGCWLSSYQPTVTTDSMPDAALR